MVLLSKNTSKKILWENVHVLDRNPLIKFLAGMIGKLEETNLLYQVKMGFDPKKKKDLLNRLYLSDLEVTAKDVYAKRDFKGNMAETLATSGQDKMQSNLDYTNNSDTNRYNKDTQKLDVSTANFSPAEIEKQNHDLVTHALMTF